MESIENKLLNFFSSYKLVTQKKGHVLLRPDDIVTNIYFLKKGLIKQYLFSEEGEEININLFRPNSFIPIMIILSQTENRYFFEAQTEIEIYQAPVSKVVDFIKAEPEVLFDLTTRFAKAINGLSIKFEESTTKTAPEKIFSLINYLAEKFGKKTATGVTIELPLTHQEIANWTGVTRETASRNLEKLVKNGLINIQSHQITLVTHVTDK